MIEDQRAAGHPTWKRWRFKAWDAHTRRYRSATFDTKPENWAWARGMQGRMAAGLDRAGRASLAHIGAEYAASLRDRGRTEKHVAQLERIVAALVASGATNLKAKRWPSLVSDWLRDLKTNWWAGADAFAYRRTERLDLSPATKNLFLRHLRGMIHYAIKRDYLDKDPLRAVSAAKVEKHLKPTFTVTELQLLLSDDTRAGMEGRMLVRQLAEHGGDKHSLAKVLGVHVSTIYNRLTAAETAGDDPWWLPFALMAYTGARAQEAMHLRWEWIDWQAEVISLRIRPEFAIKRSKERTIPLQPELVEILRPLAKPHGWIIEDEALRTASGSFNYTRAFQRFLQRAGLPVAGRGPHSCRHTYVALMLATDVNAFAVMDAVGHESLQTTQGYARAQSALRGAVKGWPRGGFYLRRSVPVVPPNSMPASLVGRLS